jgi:hypothetical protein
MTTAYFDQFPKTYYGFDNVTAYLVTNFMARVQMSDQLKSNVMLYSPYTIIDGETPEMVADKVYGDPTLHWVILLTNEIIDPRYDWCLSQEHLYSYCQQVYGSDPAQVYGTHHYVDPNTGLIVDSDFSGAVSVSNYDYEDQLNEKKRVIKILNPSLVNEFIKEFNAAMNA